MVFQNGVRPAVLTLDEARITRVEEYSASVTDEDLVDAGDLVVMPGLVDTHVHVNEPGRAEWEGFDTATQAAAAGGITTLVDMPLNSVPATTTAAALAAKREAASGQTWVDVGFWGGVVPGNIRDLEPLWRAGVLGFKCFLCPSGVDEFPHVSPDDLREACPVLTRLGAPLLVHAEDPSVLAIAAVSAPPGAWRRYGDYLTSRPDEAERDAVALLTTLAREFGTRIHVVHVASAEALDAIEEAQDAGLPVTGETCPHYLALDAAAIPDGATEFKCAPPIRGADTRDALWDGLQRSILMAVVTDHSPSPPELKLREKNFASAWGGIASLQLSLPIVWTAARRRGWTPSDIARVMCRGPAALGGLDDRGSIEIGKVADLVIWDPDAQFDVEPSQLRHRHKLTPYAGQRLFGVVRTTILKGERIFDSGELIGRPRGREVRRSWRSGG